MTNAATVDLPYELPHPLAVETGSILIERYTPSDGKGAQWVVHRVERGELTHLKVFKTRREAAEFVAGGLHLGW